ncbi:succinyl-diaminopimelate desuccinylase [Desulfonispora thiosulfatigenes DSM 11270]|uniref:Succinyl-diaminopimelate desuccinylase n=1 Tax=Desulfonispora thiosulfatigenes DSM 11270 TaxID=656914 RepID=A0A1W1VFY8_DESTI|nr:M20 family metallopeptidase [Desulfonispora thiosulfatigenes]SMB92319.1 succinyl-diaminopimelate desuccinylase [Desulfonispora thiosulfatigenes DSM 11270]
MLSIDELEKLINFTEVIEVVQNLIKISSENPPGDEYFVGKYIINYMESAGIKTEIQEISPERFNVISRLKGDGTLPPIIFTGHMDVVPVKEDELARWTVDPYSGTIKDEYVLGRGAITMKGGLGAAMVAMATLARSNLKPAGDIIFLATVDGEDVMRGAKAIINTHYISDAKRIVVCKPTDMNLVTVCKGRTWADIKVLGKSAHASIPGAGINAIDRAIRLIEALSNHKIPHQYHELVGSSFWQVTLIKGGIEAAIIPESCTITVDARLVPGQNPDEIWKYVEGLINYLKIEIPDFEASIHVIDKREPWETNDEEFIAKIEKAHNIMGKKVVKNGYLGTTDATVLRRLGIESVIIGPGQIKYAHKEDEKVSIEQLKDAVKLYLLMMVG